MPLAQTLSSLVGNTPLLRLERLSPVGRLVLGKCEFLNPGGSVKDRIGFHMVEMALERGDLSAGGTVVEPTAGNTGIALAAACVHFGLDLVAVMPERFSIEKARIVEAFGGKVVRTPSAEGMEGAIARAKEMSGQPGWWCPQQFSNPDNPGAHFATTGPEIWEQSGHDLQAFVAGVGSGGTFVGAGRFLRDQSPEILLVAVQPEGSVLLGGEAFPHKIEGIGVDNLETLGFWDPDLPDGVETVSDLEAHAMTSRIAREEGLFLGASSGALVVAARRVANSLPEGSRVATLLPDGGERYASQGLFGPFGGWTA